MFYQGRVVVLSRYELATSNAQPSMIQFVANAIRWLANGKTPIIPATHEDMQVYLCKCTLRDVIVYLKNIISTGKCMFSTRKKSFITKYVLILMC